MSFPPVILYTTPVADWIDDPIKGARVACSAASSARFLLEETPIPSIAVPEFFITACTSAKSTLTSPATTGAAPDPVPPPIPAVIKTRSDPFSAFAIASFDSSAACSPKSGFPPVPESLTSEGVKGTHINTPQQIQRKRNEAPKAVIKN
ncbi:hypothetical protein NC652_003732 [Populus alba x Populus x berolinensis]|nr:hypothetical protein NC652_003732 [Populus alba x Populus x berolinensis]